MVWYCKDFAKRLGYDVDPERTAYGLCKESEDENLKIVHQQPVHP